jgi:acyl-CoA synthetase (NDP forming)
MPDIRALLAPKSIAIVGVSDDVKTVRGRLLHVIRKRGYAGRLHLVSRSSKMAQGLPTVPTLSDIGEPVDLAIVVTPATAVPDIVEECGRLGIKGVFVVASGFSEERGGSGKALQARLGQIAAKYDLALCGPNAEGYLNNDMALAATFSPTLENETIVLDPTIPPKRSIGVTSQSGGFTFAFLSRSQGRQLRFSFMVSTGNEAVLEGADFVDFMLDDGKTDIALMYMEGLKRPDRFAEVAGKAADHGKPLIVAKTGRSEAGKRAAVSHTGSLAGESRVFDAVMREYGIVRGDDIDQMLDAAAAFTYCPLPKGRRVGLVSASGGGAVWMTETLTQQGFEIIPFDQETRSTLDALLPTYGSSQNPIDLTATAIREVGYARIIEVVDKCPTVDLIVVVGSLAYEYGIEKDRDALERVRSKIGKPVVFCTYTTASPRAIELLASAGIPTFTSMPNCAKALGALADYQAFQTRWRRDRPESAPDLGVERRDATRKMMVDAGPALCEVDAKKVLALNGIGDPKKERIVFTEVEAVSAADILGYPVALKVQSPKLLHKTEAGALALALGSAEDVRLAYRKLDEIAGKLSATDRRGILVQEMAPAGVEVIVGVKRDPQFGPIVALGLGGILVELLDDVVLAPAPITRARALELVQELRGARIFAGLRGKDAADVGALAELLHSISLFAAAHGDMVEEIDLNPVIVHRQGLSIVDALISLREDGSEAGAVMRE